jgi:hypothetical protein
MKRLFVVIVGALATLFAGSSLGSAAAQANTITFTAEPVAVASPGGTTLTVQVEVSCPARYDVLEAFIYVQQGGVSSNFVGIPLTCRPSGQQYTLTVPAPEGSVWTAGAASLSGYILLIHKSETLSTSPSAALQVVFP